MPVGFYYINYAGVLFSKGANGENLVVQVNDNTGGYYTGLFSYFHTANVIRRVIRTKFFRSRILKTFPHMGNFIQCVT
jgi:hypothetical protein